MPLEKRKQKFIEGEINLKALLIVIVKNKCLDYIKTKKNSNRIIDGIKSIWSTSTNNTANTIFTYESFESL